MKKWTAPLSLFILSLVIHFAALSHPNEVIFDEVHWGKYITSYCCSGTNLFDVHPPHGKLMVALLAKMSGYKGDQSFEKIGIPYEHVSVLALRFLSALAGSFLPPVFYILLLQLGASLPIALLGGTAILLDNGFLLQSRLMGLYPMLILSLLGSLVAFLKAESLESKKAWFYYVLSGVVCGFALGFQFTGLLAIGLISLILVAEGIAKKQEWKNLVAKGLAIWGSGTFVYLMGWVFHFALLPNPGFGDAFYRNTGNFFTDLFALHREMYRASANLTTAHQDASKWWTWPMMKMPIFYWVEDHRSLYFLGNPLVWWTASLLFSVAVYQSLRSYKTGRKEKWIAFAGFLIAFLPLVQMHRVLFLYHYLTPLTYIILFTLLWLDETGWVSSSDLKKQRLSYYLAFGFILFGFLWISPVTYGFRMPEFYWRHIPWNLYH